MTVIVTGAALGIGRGIVDRLLGDGERVVAVDRDTAPLSNAGGDIELIEGDVTDEGTIATACERAGSVTGLVVSAGISRPGPSRDFPLELWRDVLEVDLTAVFTSMRTAAKYASEGASFVAISSIASFQGFAGRAAYAASKAGVDGLVRSLSVEFAPTIRVNSVAPGYVMTDLVRRNLENGVITADAVMARTSMGRWGTPADIASAVRFLLSDEASWITGISLPVDGGWTAYGLGAQ